MNVKEMLDSPDVSPGDRFELFGWLVDTDDGLFVLGDHYPEDYLYPYRVKIKNGNIIYPILENVPSLGGGRSLIFYRAKTIVVLECQSPWLVTAESLSVEVDRGSGCYVVVNIDQEIVDAYVKSNGDYKFSRPRNPMRDWLDD
ncbi:hypothetical protein [Burkholderia multivorans]|uniref:hypothetical protein n=1 Tax=Burkholderia multivorans TaxID=87883 RepID=UPI001C21F81E|nr:hypothetical protein [Burkholderia multivorans]MBU9162154.1 hypothetical protein [Burkholderia multivorans]MBU9261062.1 hypothetical protein [Burkholderia multivorans]MBU9543366.1 hypothetical protein [Burkholderia multivorans]MCA8175128.1 hypothetical protein [Burkholderia multivorans]